MRKVILEQASPSVQEVKDANLKALVDLCPEYKSLQPGLNKDKLEVLVKKPNSVGGYTYVYPDYSFRSYKADGTPSERPTGRIKVCQAATGKISPAFGPNMLSAVAALKEKYKGYVELSSDIIGQVVSGVYKPVDLYNLNKEVFSTPNTWFLYDKTGIKQSFANIPDSVEKFATEQGVSFNMPPSAEEQYKTARKLGERAPLLLKVKAVVDWAAKQYPGVSLGDVIVYEVAPKEGEKTFNPANKEACKIKIKELYKLSVCNQKPEGRGNCSAQLKQMGSELDKLKRNVAGCLTNSLMFRQFMGIGLKKEVNVLGNTDSPDYDNQLGVGREIVALRSNAAGDGVTLNESYDKHLKQLVREHLTRLSNSKKKKRNY